MAMNLSLTKLPWYGQIGLFVVLGAAGAGVFWNWYAVPARASLDERYAQLATLQATIDRGLATARRLPEFRAEVAALEAQFAALRTVLPEERDVADLLRRVQGMATESNLSIRIFRPQDVARRQLHAEWPIGLELEGTFHDLGAFLDRVSRFPRIINVSGIRIRGVDTDESGAATIVAECTATTFVLLDPAEPAAAQPARGRAPRTE